MDTPLEWSRHGSFRIAFLNNAPNGLIYAGLDVYSENFRQLAHRLNARWKPDIKAWVFRRDACPGLLDQLTRLDEEIVRDAARAEQDLAELRREQELSPFIFQGAKLSIQYDAESGCIIVRRPYGYVLYLGGGPYLGGRWCKQRKGHLFSLRCLEPLKRATAKVRAEQDLFDQRNAEWLALENIMPLAPPIPRPCDPSLGRVLGLEISASPEHKTYELKLPFPIDSFLGQALALSPLEEMRALAPVRIQDVDHAYPLLKPNSIVFEMGQRALVQQAMAAIQAQLNELGPGEKIAPLGLLSAGSGASDLGRQAPQQKTKRAPSSSKLAPLAGDLFMAEHQAWIISGISSSSKPPEMMCHRISAERARTHSSRLSAASLARSARASGIDMQAWPAYLEALLLRESSSGSTALEPRKPIRL